MQLQENTTTANPILADSAQVSIKVFETIEEIETLKEFGASCSGARDSDIDIILAAHRSSPAICRPYILALYRGKKLDALLIGRVLHTELPFQVGYLCLFKPLVRILAFPYEALRGNGSLENCELLVRHAMKSLKSGAADLVLLEHVDLTGNLYRAGTQVGGLLCRDWFSPVRPHWKMKLPKTFAEIQSGLSSRERKEYRQVSKKLYKDYSGQIKVVKLERASDLNALLQDVEEVAKKTWQRKLGHAGFNTGAALYERLRLEAEKGWLRIYILYLEGKPVAFSIGAVYQKTYVGDFIGFDSNYTSYSLGSHLFYLILEDLCVQEVQVFDFGFSDEDYKRRFSNLIPQEVNLHLFPSTLRGFRLSMLRVFTTLISNLSRAVLKRAGLMQRVKRLWRKGK